MKIPKSYKQLTVKQFQEISSLQEDEIKDTLDLFVERFAILSNEDPEHIKTKVPYQDLISLAEKMRWLNKLPSESKINWFIFKGIPYRMTNLLKMSLGEFALLDDLITDSMISNAHKILAIMFRPIGFDKYDEDSFIKRSNTFKSLTMDIAYPSLLFFYRIVWVALSFILREENQLQQTMETQMKKEDLNQQIIGIG